MLSTLCCPCDSAWVAQQHQQHQICCIQTARSVRQGGSLSIPSTYLFQRMLILGRAALSTSATLPLAEDTNCTIYVAMQIIQHTGHLPGSEDVDSIKAQPSPRVQRQSSDLSALRPKRQDRPQQLQGNVEGILTLQLSHLNVVHTFRAVTIPAQVRHAMTSHHHMLEKNRKD